MAAADAVREAATCRGLHKVYATASGDVHALTDVDVVVAPACVTAFVGPSGSGKSSLLRILACVDRPTSGAVRVGGRDVGEISARRRRRLRRRLVGYVFQDPADNVLPYLTAAEHVRLAADVRGRGRRDGLELLEALGLGARLGHRPQELSGGELQRLAFASAVVGAPALVVADEPTAQLDSATAEVVLAAVRDLARRGSAIVVSSHDPLVMAAADHVVRLDQGRVVRP